MRDAEHRDAGDTNALSQGDAESRHRSALQSLESQANNSHKHHVVRLIHEFNAALSHARALPGQPCQG